MPLNRPPIEISQNPVDHAKSAAQYYRARGIKENQAQPGDLVWRPGHVALYLGVPGAVLQAPDWGRKVEIQLMNERISSWVRYADPIE